MPNHVGEVTEFLWTFRPEGSTNDTALSHYQVFTKIASVFDTGLYKCTADSNIGRAYASVNITVYPKSEGYQQPQLSGEVTAPIIGVSAAVLVLFLIATGMLVYFDQQKKKLVEETLREYEGKCIIIQI